MSNYPNYYVPEEEQELAKKLAELNKARSPSTYVRNAIRVQAWLGGLIKKEEI